MSSLRVIRSHDESDASDWRAQLRLAITSIEQLERAFDLTPAERTGAERALREGLPLSITPHYAALADRRDPRCPIRLQCVPTASESIEVLGDLRDPLGEEAHTVVPHLVRRYPDRALLVATDRCSVYCRFCTRSRIVGQDGGARSLDALAPAFAWLRDHPDVVDVIVSGGDPLIASDARVEAILSELASIESIETVRIATRAPVTLPQRITPELCRVLRTHPSTWVMTHFNHPKELAPAALTALARLADHGVPVMNQTVLLRGVNDDATTLATLFRGLVRHRTRPYYLLQADPVRGTSHLRTPIETGLAIMRELSGRMSGIALPKLVVDTPNGRGKVAIAPDTIVRSARASPRCERSAAKTSTTSTPLTHRASMAFREDDDALRARIDSLEKDLEEARAGSTRLRDTERERDQIRARLEQLEGKNNREREKKRERAAPPSFAGSGLPSSFQPRLLMLLVACALLLVAGLGVWLFAEGSFTSSPLAPKPPDTRAPSLGVVDLATTPMPAPILFSVTGTDDPPAGCRGYLPSAPQLVLRAAGPTLVQVTTRCNVDLVAVLSGTPSGTLCDDDGGEGTNPMIQTTLQAGDARLTIGTYSQGSSASCTIEIHAVPLPTGTDARGLATSATPTLGVVSLSGAATMEPSYAGQVASPPIRASTLASGCVGYVASTPDLVLDVAEPTIARVETSSTADLVLVMLGPDGSFTCDDDDGFGNAPRIAKRLAPGRYPVWIGTFSSGVSASFTADVHLTTIASEQRAEIGIVDLADGATAHVIGSSSDELSAASMWSDCTILGYVPYEPTYRFRLAARRDVVTSIVAGRGLMLAIAPEDRSSAVHAWCTTDASWRGTLETGVYGVYVGVASGDVAAGAIDVAITPSPPSVLPYTP
jgi:lysine 2,3-aminomutase